MQEVIGASTAKPMPSTLMSGWISRTELAHQLGVSEDTLRRWDAARSGPPCIRAGRKIYYRCSALLDWLEEQETSAPRRKRAGGRR
ncbi:helix-turn-helix domain-containing protein [Pararhodobacter sp.]|uniref:helix-turn-helix domain-containing protein n=1 Tax=Pararhodobacter sp. TaxID=2127056 RepID=UPI002AFF2CFD|nr:helix-turn-helix domain-containing protein [Pararhodobacter sp.]